jgi:hypothetical protein
MRCTGERFQVSKIVDGSYLLVGDQGDRLIDELGFARPELGVWEKWVAQEDIEQVWEETIPL